MPRTSTLSGRLVVMPQTKNSVRRCLHRHMGTLGRRVVVASIWFYWRLSNCPSRDWKLRVNFSSTLFHTASYCTRGTLQKLKLACRRRTVKQVIINGGHLLIVTSAISWDKNFSQFSTKFLKSISLIAVKNLLNSSTLHWAEKTRQNGLTVTEFCSQWNAIANDDIGKWIECTLSFGWIWYALTLTQMRLI